MTERGFFDTLETQLGAGLERVTQQRRSRRRLAQRAGGAALVLLLATGIGAFALRSEPASAGVDVEQRDGLVYVRLTDVEYRADVIEDAARAAGIDVTVDAVPTGPSLVGRFVGFDQAGEETGELRKLDADGPAFAGFTIPAGYDGTLVLQVGRPAKNDEPYFIFSNALSEREPLACSGILDADVDRARAIAESKDLDVRWNVATNGGVRVVDTEELAELDLDGLRVRRVESLAPRSVSITLATQAVQSPVEHTADAIC